MTREDARERVESIRAAQADNEKAHRPEDQLFEDFVRHVFEHAPEEFAEVARVVLETDHIDYMRWYA